MVAAAKSPARGRLSVHPPCPVTLGTPEPGVYPAVRPGLPQSAPLQPGHRAQGLGWRPHGEGWGGCGVQGGGAEAGRGQEAVPLEEAHEQQEELRPGQALPHTDTAACKGHGGAGWGLLSPGGEGIPGLWWGEPGPPACRAVVPAEKGRKAARFTKRPSASRKWPGLNWRGVSHCVLSRSTELSRGTTGVPCGQAAGGLAGRPVHPGQPDGVYRRKRPQRRQGDGAGPGRSLLGAQPHLPGDPQATPCAPKSALRKPRVQGGCEAKGCPPLHPFPTSHGDTCPHPPQAEEQVDEGPGGGQGLCGPSPPTLGSR